MAQRAVFYREKLNYFYEDLYYALAFSFSDLVPIAASAMVFQLRTFPNKLFVRHVYQMHSVLFHDRLSDGRNPILRAIPRLGGGWPNDGHDGLRHGTKPIFPATA